MWIKKTKVNFKDGRGEIRDLLTKTDIDAITFITSTKGSVRGNHYHKKTVQYDYVISGKFELYTKQMPNSKITKKILKAGDIAFHPAMEAHTFVALEDSVFLSLTKGPRNGEDYEKDTIRLEKSLVK
jgi:quercetin dioxygenase-like cupin family protein